MKEVFNENFHFTTIIFIESYEVNQKVKIISLFLVLFKKKAS
jgi:hypothetical protein